MFICEKSMHGAMTSIEQGTTSNEWSRATRAEAASGGEQGKSASGGAEGVVYGGKRCTGGGTLYIKQRQEGVAGHGWCTCKEQRVQFRVADGVQAMGEQRARFGAVCRRRWAMDEWRAWWATGEQGARDYRNSDRNRDA